MTIEEIQNKPYGEICATLAELGPQVLAARARYNELIAQQRQYIIARDLLGAGLRLGDKVRMTGLCLGKRNPVAVVVEPGISGLMFQLLRKDGKPHGEPQPEFAFQGYELLE